MSVRLSTALCMLTALGYGFYDANGDRLPPVFDSLGKIEEIRAGDVPDVLHECRFQIACDVNNPLSGPRGAVSVFGPQKGVKPEETEAMDRAMARFAKKAAAFTGRDRAETPGAGAAGGLGFALMTFLENVTLRPGTDIVFEAIGLESAVKDADVVVTGEGRMDGQTAMGKVPVGVARLAKRYGCKVVAFAGGVTEDAVKCNDAGIDAFFPIVRGVTTLDEAMEKETAMRNMELAAEQTFRLLRAMA